MEARIRQRTSIENKENYRIQFLVSQGMYRKYSLSLITGGRFLFVTLPSGCMGSYCKINAFITVNKYLVFQETVLSHTLFGLKNVGK